MRALEEKLQYHFKNPALLEEALRHSSYANEHRGANFFSNERLEFLGDSVLGFVTAEYLFAKHPAAPEGELTRIRALLVCEDSLHEVAQRLELGKHLKLGNGEESCGGRTPPPPPKSPFTVPASAPAMRYFPFSVMLPPALPDGM